MKTLLRVQVIATICLALILLSCDQKTTVSALTDQETRSIFYVTEAMLFLGATKNDFEKYAETVFQQIDAHYHLEKGCAKLIFLAGKRERNWELSMDRKMKVVTELSDRTSWTVQDVQSVIGENSQIGKSKSERTRGEQTVAKFVDELRKAKDSHERYESVNKLVECGKFAVEPLIAALKDNNPQVRGFAAYALGEIGDRRAFQPLIDVLNDQGVVIFFDLPNFVGDAAAAALVKFKDASVIPHFEKCLVIVKENAKKNWMEWGPDSLDKAVANKEFLKNLQSFLPRLKAIDRGQ